ncbi:acyl-CoA carboxylase subunit epsilon [Sphaerisporangium aureirubrum]|uniref:Acyl-CoA carboxylase subunit epsilon n=1 Tax=Sphaerisporangium aureirubrum TaxID=1544736 RepID=A0ABW1NCW0_9ACTN
MEQPYLRIVRGDATPEEVAALVIALTTRATSPDQTPRNPGTWRSRAHQLRRGLPRGPGAWRASSRPY